MNPKEKALDIKSEYWGGDSTECAIIHVEGIIEEHRRYFTDEQFKERLEYWQEVLKELNQM